MNVFTSFNQHTIINDHKATWHLSIFMPNNRELLFSIICGAALLTGFLMEITGQSWYLPVYLFAYFFGSYFMLIDIWNSLTKGKFEIDFLMFAAAIGAGILHRWSEGALLLFLFSMGHALEHFALDKAHRSIAALAQLAPKTALIKNNDDILEVAIEELKVGDIVVVHPNTKIAADGLVIKGSSAVDQSNITGESMPVEKMPLIGDDDKDNSSHRVFSGTLNGQGYLEIRVTRTTNNTTLSQLIRLVNEAKEQESPTQLFTKKIEKVYVPAVLTFVVALNFAFLFLDESFSQSFYRAITVLVVASPCALVLSTPSAVLSGIARAANKGILMKGGKPLEQLGKLKAIAFDKTGTLTKGQPGITDVITLNGHDKEDLLAYVVAIEKHSDHPLAKALVKAGANMYNGAKLPDVQNFKSITGKGVAGEIENRSLLVGNREIFQSPEDAEEIKRLTPQLEVLEQQGKTNILIKLGKEFIGIVSMMDLPREESLLVVKTLKSMGLKRIIMLSGDHQKVADSIGRQVGITESWGNLLPEQKAKAIQKIKQEETHVAMVGDGVNDAPAMAYSTVGIAMGAAGSDVALETADVALMSDKIGQLPFAIGLSQSTRKIILQNLIISMGVIVVMIPLALLGITSIGPAVIIHEGSTILVVFNALRLLKYQLKLKE